MQLHGLCQSKPIKKHYEKVFTLLIYSVGLFSLTGPVN